MVNLLWDLDGTLIDSFSIIAQSLNATTAHFNKPAWPEAQIQRMIGPELGLILQEMLSIEEQAHIDAAKAVYRRHYVEQMSQSPIFPGIKLALSQLNDMGATQYVATAKYQAYAQQILADNGLAPEFVGIYGSEEGGRLGNKIELLAHLLAEENIQAAQTIMIGDTKYDIAAGRHHNMTTIAVAWGYGSEAELKEAGAHFFAHSAEELPELIKQAMTCAC